MFDQNLKSKIKLPQENNPSFRMRVVPQCLSLTERLQNDKLVFNKLNFPNELPDYSRKDYWNARYSYEKGESNEWLQPYKSIRPHVLKVYSEKLNKLNALYLGCGNSVLALEMAQEGLFQSIVCVDFSETLIKDLQNSIPEYVGSAIVENSRLLLVTYTCMDVCENLEFPIASQDLLIDKGLIDSILCGQGCTVRVQNYLAECWRVLTPRGTLMILSQGHPDTRVLYLKNKKYPFHLNIQEIDKEQMVQFEKFDDQNHHFLYICTKING